MKNHNKSIVFEGKGFHKTQFNTCFCFLASNFAFRFTARLPSPLSAILKTRSEGGLDLEIGAENYFVYAT